MLKEELFVRYTLPAAGTLAMVRKSHCVQQQQSTCNFILQVMEGKSHCVEQYQSYVELHTASGGRNSSVGSAWARCPQRPGSDPPLGKFSVEGISPLEVTWVQTPFPKNSFG